MSNIRVRVAVLSRTRKAFVAGVSNKLSPGDLVITLPGGPVDEGEKPVNAAVRHLRTDFGISVQPEDLQFYQRKSYDVLSTVGTGSSDVTLATYRIDLPDAVPYNCSSEKHLAVSWMTMCEVERLTRDDNWKLQPVVEECLKSLFDIEVVGNDVIVADHRDTDRPVLKFD